MRPGARIDGRFNGILDEILQAFDLMYRHLVHGLRPFHVPAHRRTLRSACPLAPGHAVPAPLLRARDTMAETHPAMLRRIAQNYRAFALGFPLPDFCGASSFFT
jgi:hypothetical protein